MNHNPQEVHPMSSTVSEARHELQAQYVAIDQILDAIAIPAGLNYDQTTGALLVADQVIEAIKAQKKAIRAALAKLI